MDKQKIELRSDEFQEVMGSPPSWMVRYGIASVFIILAILVGISNWIQYPDYYKSEELSIQQFKNQTLVQAPSSGIIDYLVSNGTSINESDTLASILFKPVLSPISGIFQVNPQLKKGDSVEEGQSLGIIIDESEKQLSIEVVFNADIQDRLFKDQLVEFIIRGDGPNTSYSGIANLAKLNPEKDELIVTISANEPDQIQKLFKQQQVLYGEATLFSERKSLFDRITATITND